MSSNSGILYIVATPIGNLGDISTRALKILQSVSAVVCEDTRVTKKLLTHYNINVPVTAYHHHSSPAVTEHLVGRLVSGESLAYVSDAGTPGVADPVGKLVAVAVGAGVKVVPIPGASAVTVALSIAGINIQSYLFLGFPPHKKGRQTWFKSVASSEYPVVFFESTHRILKCLVELTAVVPKRHTIVCRELTKMFETVYRGCPADIIDQLKKTSTKGEFVIVVAPA